MKQKADIVTLYKILACPYPIYVRDIMKIYGCSESHAHIVKKTLQNTYCSKTGIVCDTSCLTKEQFFIATGWDWEEIRKEALAIMALQSNRAWQGGELCQSK